MAEPTPVYLIFGLPGSGRREVLYDLIEGGLPKEESVLYFRPEEEPDSAFDEQIDALANTQTVGWKLNEGKVKHGPITAAPDKVIFLAPGTAAPPDVAEALKSWIDHNGCQLARIVSLVHCSFLEAVPKAQPWIDACIHFSDVVLLGRREAVDNKWLKDFEARYRRDCYPCLFELVVKGKAKNPVAVLEPQARRLSLYFDELIPIEEDGLEADEQPEDLKPDRFIERNEGGQRRQPLPDMARLLEQAG